MLCLPNGGEKWDLNIKPRLKRCGRNKTLLANVVTIESSYNLYVYYIVSGTTNLLLVPLGTPPQPYCEGHVFHYFCGSRQLATYNCKRFVIHELYIRITGFDDEWNLIITVHAACNSLLKFRSWLSAWKRHLLLVFTWAIFILERYIAIKLFLVSLATPLYIGIANYI